MALLLLVRSQSWVWVDQEQERCDQQLAYMDLLPPMGVRVQVLSNVTFDNRERCGLFFRGTSPLEPPVIICRAVRTRLNAV